MNSPFYAQSRAGSTENLAALGMTSATAGGVPPAALSSRLANVSLDSSDRLSAALHGDSNPPTSHPSQPTSTQLTRHNSAEDGRASDHSTTPSHPHQNLRSGRVSPEHVESIDLAALSKVPSYTTALRTPARSRSHTNEALPDYRSAMSAPTTPLISESSTVDPLSVIHEGRVQDAPHSSRTVPNSPSGSPPRLASGLARSPRTGGVMHQMQGHDERVLHLLQARDRIY